MANNLTSAGILSLLNTMDASFDKIRLKGKIYFNQNDFDPFYTDFQAVGTKLSVISPKLILNEDIVFPVSYPGGTVIELVLEEVELYADDETTFYLTAPLDQQYSYDATGSFTLTDLEITLS